MYIKLILLSALNLHILPIQYFIRKVYKVYCFIQLFFPSSKSIVSIET